MVDVHPFRAWRYDLAQVGDLSDVVAPPYDVIDENFRSVLYKKHPCNVIRVDFNREEPSDPSPDAKYARAAGIRKKVTPHTFRLTFATDLVRNGAEITAVQRMLGHANISVTQLYTHVAGVEVKKTHRLSHPRERDVVVKEDIAPDIRTVKEPRRRY